MQFGMFLLEPRQRQLAVEAQRLGVGAEAISAMLQPR